jgi:outer membrane lipopolysaccharide assembly protein LptE/RlpB
MKSETKSRVQNPEFGKSKMENRKCGLPDFPTPNVQFLTPARRSSLVTRRGYPQHKLPALTNWSLVTRHLSLITAFLIVSSSCGYHMAGRGDRLPPDIRTLAIPTFQNETGTFRIEQSLTSAVTREFIERTRFRLTPRAEDADAVLKGTIKDARAGVITFDVNTGRATSLQIQVTADVKLEDQHTHKVVFANPNYVFREEYQVSQSASGLFEEDQPAIDRLSRDLARTLVTEILENF